MLSVIAPDILAVPDSPSLPANPKVGKEVCGDETGSMKPGC